MIKANLEKEILVSGSGRKYHFNREVYLKVVKFLMKKFNISYNHACGQLDYFLVTDVIRKNGKFVHISQANRKATNARLNNIVNLDYEWKELFHC